MAAESLADHFEHPRNVGEIEHPDAVGSGGNPVCGDEVTATFRLREGAIEDVRFRAYGCHATIAVMSRLTEWIRGRTTSEARSLSRGDVTGWFTEFPRGKLHAADLALDVLSEALEERP